MTRFILGFALGVAAAVGVLVGTGHFLAVEDPLAPADAIVALSGDEGPRTETAIRLWKDGHAPFIVFAGGSEDPLSPSSAELMKRHATDRGVPADRILVEAASGTTKENAQRVTDLLSAHGIEEVILVTSPFHQRRASWHFSRQLEGTGISLRNFPARDPEWDATLWWAREPSRSVTLVELAKLGAEVVGAVLRRG